jgi:hypothetical protein
VSQGNKPIVANMIERAGCKHAIQFSDDYKSIAMDFIYFQGLMGVKFLDGSFSVLQRGFKPYTPDPCQITSRRDIE